MSTSEFVLIKLQVYIVQTVTLLQPNSPQALFRICSEKRYSELPHSSFPKIMEGFLQDIFVISFLKTLQASSV